MQSYNFTATIGASALRLSTLAIAAGAVLPGNSLYSSSYLPSCKLFLEVRPSATGLLYVGPSTVSNAGANAEFIIQPGSGANPGGSTSVESQEDANVIDLANYWIHGSVPGDTISVVYHQS